MRCNGRSMKTQTSHKREAGVENGEDHCATGMETHISNHSVHSLQCHDYVSSFRMEGEEEWGMQRVDSIHACKI